MLDPKLQFVCYGAAVACFLLAALGGSTARGALARVDLIPLGLAFFVFPFLWNAATAAF